MSVKDCVAKLVKVGSITREIGEEALGLYERSRAEYGRTMGPAQADAAAALATARAMEAGARKLKNDVAKQALAYAAAEKRVLGHRRGRTAGAMSLLVRDIWEEGGENVATKAEVIAAQLFRKFEAGMEAFAPGLLGQSRAQLAGLRNMERELFGVSTGDNLAVRAAKGWREATAEAVQRAIAAGRNITPDEDWRLPQFWDSRRVRNVSREEFARDFKAEVERGNLVLWDRDTGKPATLARRDFIIDRAYTDIKVRDSAAAVLAPEMRTFKFAGGEDGAAAFLRLQDKYGAGQDVAGILTGHLQRMANEIALAEVVGPNHGAIMKALMRHVNEEDAELRGVRRLNPLRMIESRSMVQRTYDMLTGRANAVEGPMMAGIFGGLRSINTAAKLGGAVITAVPGDTVTSLLAAGYNGMAPGRILGGALRELSRGGAESRQLAARLQFVAHSAMDFNHGFRRFTDEVSGPRALRAMANVVIRAQGLAAWTDLMKRTFTMEFMGHLADHAGYTLAGLAEVNRPLANFLDRHRISAGEWDALRKAPVIEADGGRFLDLSGLADRAAAERLTGAVVEERAFAILEPDARIRAAMIGGTTAGTFWGEMVRSAGMFKSFSVTMIATHAMRIATQGPIESRIWNGVAFVLFNLFAGAAAIQARAIVNGKTPEPMGNAAFWARSGLQSGSMGIYGDLINSSMSRSGRSPAADIAGPVIGMTEDVARLSSAQLRRLYEGSDATFGAELVRTARRYDPGTWYTRLAVDRLLFDQLQTLVDPDYRASFRRAERAAEKDYGQEFWWAPGNALPGR